MKSAPIFGGVFALEAPVRPSEPPFSAPNTQYFLNVRCALNALLYVLRPRNVWLPSYLCPSVVEPFRSCGVEIRYYGVNEYLHVAGGSWLEDIRHGDFVIAIHYFGLPQSDFPAAEVQLKQAHLIEDSSQALFLPLQFEQSLCALYSPRKFLGVPDSGVMVSKGKTGTESLKLDPPPNEWWTSALAMGLRRRDFDLTGRPNDWYSLFQHVEANFPLGLYQASDLSRALLTCGIDYEAIRKRRRANYRALLNMLGDYALFPELPEPAVPVGFPVRIDPAVRDRVLQRLHSRRVYAPVHWELDGAVPDAFEQSHSLARCSLTLVCDQRYSTDDMIFEACEFNDALQACSRVPSIKAPLS